MQYTIVPGYGGSGPEHWQSRWQPGLPGAVRIRPASWELPEPVDWQRALDRAAAAHDDAPALLIAHSLGTLAATEWALTHPELVAGLFLVAVPDPANPVFPAAAREFRRPRGPLGIPAVMVCSTDDPFCSVGRARSIAADWHIEILEAGACGHLNTTAGFGPWPEGRELLAGFEQALTAYC